MTLPDGAGTRDRPSTTERGVGLAVDFDPAIWLPGPTNQSTQDWLDLAFRGCAQDFGVEPDTAEASYLHTLLTEFATRDLFGDFRFLRLRTLIDAPLSVQLGLIFDAQPGELEVALTELDPDATYYDSTTRVELIDAERGLRRSIAFAIDDGIRPVVRYHRRVDQLGVDVVLSSAGADLRATTEGLAEIDALARAVWLVDAHGLRR